MSPLLPLLPYTELCCLSNYSFLRGASHPEELVARAAALGYEGLALVDECSLAGIVKAHVEAQRQQIALLVGASFVLRRADGTVFLEFVALAESLEGYGNLCELITLARQRGSKGSYLLYDTDLAADVEAVAAADAAGRPAVGRQAAPWLGLPGCVVVLLPEYAALPSEARPVSRLQAQADWLARVFPGRAWVGLALHQRGRDRLHAQSVVAAAGAAGLPVVAVGQAEMHDRSRKPLHDTLLAIRLGKTVADCGLARLSNAERHLRSRARLAALYEPQWLLETGRLAARCRFRMHEVRYAYPEEICPPGHTPETYLRQEAWAGAQRRFPGGIPDTVRALVEKELGLIAELGYEAYFLTVYDIVRYARSQGILCQGRGSAANSAVCFCLGITEVDPVHGNLLFARFISKERGEPPDIDVDFEHQRREEVIQYIYTRYGRDRAALAAVVITYRMRSALRDTGMALGIDAGLIDQVCAAYRHWDGRDRLAERMQAAGLQADAPVARQWQVLVETLLGFPRHLSQHPGGFVIARDRLVRLVPVENAAMAGRSVVQWDKDDLDALGLLKVDVLALGMLSVLRRALAWTAWRRGRGWGLQDIPADDGPTYDMICAAETVGVFQIESRAQMSMLPRLRPREYYDLVIQVAIVRPGPIQGGMVHPYLRRRQGLEDSRSPGPEIEQALLRTKGVPIFQEQVMQIAMLAAGFTDGEADNLRRSMAAWRRRGGLGGFHEKILSGMTARGYTAEFAEQIFRQIQGFGEYGFPESHAASFAQLAYASAWLKRHEPEAFLAALLDSQPMGFYSPSILVQDARRQGVQVLPVSVCESVWETLLIPAGRRPAVRLGLSQVKGLAQAAVRRLLAARAQQAFEDIQDIAQRALLAPDELRVLAACGALAGLRSSRRAALWEAGAARAETGLLRGAPRQAAQLPLFEPMSAGAEVLADYQHMGLSLGPHPVRLLRAGLQRQRLMTAAQLRGLAHGRMARACGIVVGRQRPGTAKGVMFVTLEDETGSVNVIVRPAWLERQRAVLLGAQLLAVHGVWQIHEGVGHLVLGRAEDLSPLLGGLATQSRDFQ
ncbi:error-prone DNA polymerase [Kerstersia sp.]|uniref:error-prone DNA polymerase n=1 Tax=Kerstersia sp. TaxID=1930783 RepID=UPI003F90DBB0